MTPARTLWVASDKVKSAVPFAPDGKMGPGLGAARTCRALSLAPNGELLVMAARARCASGRRTCRPSPSPATSPGRRSRSRSSRPRCVDAGRRRARGGREEEEGLPLRRQAPVPGALPRRARSAQVTPHRPRRRRRHRDARPRRAHGARAWTRRASRSASSPRAARLRAAQARSTSPSTPSATSTWRTRRRACSSSRPQGQLLATLGRRGRAQGARGHRRPHRRRARLRRQAAADPEVQMKRAPLVPARCSLARSGAGRAAPRARRRAPPPPGPLSEAVQKELQAVAGPARPRHRRVRGPAAEPLHRRSSTRSSRGSRSSAARARCPRAAARSWLQRLRAARPRVLQHRPAGEGGGQLPLARAAQPAVSAEQGEASRPRSSTTSTRVKKALVGYLAVSSSPAGAKVSLNGEFLSLTDFFPLEVLAGEYTVEIAREGYRTETRTISIAPKATETLQVELTRTLASAFVVDGAGGRRDLAGRPAPDHDQRHAWRPSCWRRCARRGSTRRAPPAARRARRTSPSAAHNLELRQQVLRDGEAPDRSRRRPATTTTDAHQARGLAWPRCSSAPNRRGRASSWTARPWASRPKDLDGVCSGKHRVEVKHTSGKFIQDVVLAKDESLTLDCPIRPSLAYLGVVAESAAGERVPAGRRGEARSRTSQKVGDPQLRARAARDGGPHARVREADAQGAPARRRRRARPRAQGDGEAGGVARGAGLPDRAAARARSCSARPCCTCWPPATPCPTPGT